MTAQCRWWPAYLGLPLGELLRGHDNLAHNTLVIEIIKSDWLLPMLIEFVGLYEQLVNRLAGNWHKRACCMAMHKCYAYLNTDQ